MKSSFIFKAALFSLGAWVFSNPFLQSFAQAERETYLPAGYTPPKIAAGNGGVAIAGPTPFFNNKSNGSSIGIGSVQSGKQATSDPQLKERLKQINGNTELMIAAVTGDTALVKGLLNQGAEVNAANKFGSTALMGAAAGGYIEIVQALLEKSANVNIQGKDGSTALMFAARNGHFETVQTLLKYGADVKTQAKDGQTALKLAGDQGYTEIANLLGGSITKKE